MTPGLEPSTVPMPFVTMLLAAAEQLYGTSELSVQRLQDEGAGDRLRIAISGRARPDCLVVGTLGPRSARIDIALPGPVATAVPAGFDPMTTPTPPLWFRGVRVAARRRAADLAFSAHDFAPEQLIDVGRWRFETSDNTWTRTLVLAAGIRGSATRSCTFAVSFIPQTATVEEIFILPRST